MKAVGAGVAGTAAAILARVGGFPLLVLFGVLLLTVTTVVLFLFDRLIRQVLLAADDDPASRLERILRIVLRQSDRPIGDRENPLTHT